MPDLADLAGGFGMKIMKIVAKYLLTTTKQLIIILLAQGINKIIQ
jgi:hypothetical protein